MLSPPEGKESLLSEEEIIERIDAGLDLDHEVKKRASKEFYLRLRSSESWIKLNHLLVIRFQCLSCESYVASSQSQRISG